MEKKIKPFNESKDIKDECDFSEYASAMLDNFLESFTIENGLIKMINEDDEGVDESWTFLYTDKGMKLKERYESRLANVAEAHEFELDLILSNYKEL